MAYEFKEFPKWIKDKDGKDIIVQNPMEEAPHSATKETKEEKKSKKEW